MSINSIVGIAILLIIVLVLMRMAYRQGVRDGYQNNWLPHVQEQIQDEGLENRKDIKHG